MRLLALCLIALGLLAQAAQAQAPQATVRVEVTSESGPVPGAEVKLNRQAAHTGRDGVATVSVPLGPLKVTVSKEGFLPSSTTVDIDTAKEWVVQSNCSRRKKWRRRSRCTPRATTSASRMRRCAWKSCSAKRSKRKMLMTPGDIVMMLNEMGGMRVQTTSPSLGAASVRMQGMRGRYTRFLSDGLPLFGQQGAGLGLLQIPPMDLGQVEVIKGTASALYGAGAMAGVVNLISRRPSSEPVREFLVNRTTLGGRTRPRSSDRSCHNAGA
jgi:outer membrane receptor for ferrienterochelin and colicins